MAQLNGCEEVTLTDRNYDIIRPTGNRDEYQHLLNGDDVGGEQPYFQPTVTVGAGETWENKLLEAPVGIQTSGGGWTIRNIGVRGSFGSDGTALSPYTPSGEEGTIENVYIGDGSANGSAVGCWVSTLGSDAHEGHIFFDRINVGGFADNGLYCSGPASKNHAGTCTIENSFGHHNNISQFRLAREGDEVRNCVVDVTNPGIVPGPAGPNGRGYRFVDGDGSRALVENCRGINASWHAVEAEQGSCVQVRDSCIEGAFSGCIDTSNVDRSGCDVSPPSGVPMSPEEAASGEGGGGGGGGGDEGVPGEPTETRSMTITGPTNTDTAFYRFEVKPSQQGTDAIVKTGEPGPGADADDEVIQLDNGNWAVEGGAALGGTDTFDVTGYFKGFTSPSGHTFGVQVNGRSVPMGDLQESEEEEENGGPQPGGGLDIPSWAYPLIAGGGAALGGIALDRGSGGSTGRNTSRRR